MKNKKLLTCVCIYFLLIKGTFADNVLPVVVERIEHSTRVEKISEEESSRRLADAKLLFNRGKTDAAIYMLQKLSEADPDNYQVLLELGRIAVGAKNWAYAINVFRKAALVRPEDIEVRLILMDVYKAYQMPIQEIIVAKEVFALDPDQLVAATRLSELYQEQAMYEEEINTRRVVRRLNPRNYKNLKRLAEVLFTDSQLWESAKIYEDIRKFYPGNLSDLRKLVSIYAALDENFHETVIYDHIDEIASGTSTGKKKVIERIREKMVIVDPAKAGISYKNASESTLSLDRYDVFADYTHLLTRSSFNLGVETKYGYYNYRGKDVLTGKLHINNASILLKGSHFWKGGDYLLSGNVGVVHDDISGRLSGRNQVLTADDFPFLEDPTFNSYGGTIPVGGVSFAARPWMKELVYRLDYNHSLVEELDARLSLFTQDKVSLSAFYQSRNMTDAYLTIENIFVSDGNYRFRAKAGGFYTLWGSGGMYDFRGRRRGFFRPPQYYVRAGYEITYFKDDRIALNNKYETFVNSEIRHEGILSGQSLVYRFESNDLALFNLRLSYGAGTTLDYRKSAQAKLSYYLPDNANSVDLAYSYENELSTNTTAANLQIAGFAESHQLSLDFNWHF